MVFFVSNVHAAPSLAVEERGFATPPSIDSGPDWSPSDVFTDQAAYKTAETTSFDNHHDQRSTKTLRNLPHVASDGGENHALLAFDASKELGVLSERNARVLQDECHGDRPVIGDGPRFEIDIGQNQQEDTRFLSLVRDCIYQNERCPYTAPLGCWNTSKITTMRSVFIGSRPVPPGITSWDTSSVTDMANMFSRNKNFNTPLASWNTSSVKYMQGMFYRAEAFNQPIGSWDTSSVQNMKDMFYEAYSFNQPVDWWNVSRVTNMRSMFRDAHAFNQPLGSWDVSSVDMLNDGLFHFAAFAYSFNQCLSEWSPKLPWRGTSYFMFSKTSCPYQLASRDCVEPSSSASDCDSIVPGPWCQGPAQQCYHPAGAFSTWGANGVTFLAAVTALPTLALLFV